MAWGQKETVYTFKSRWIVAFESEEEKTFPFPLRLCQWGKPGAVTVSFRGQSWGLQSHLAGLLLLQIRHWASVVSLLCSGPCLTSWPRGLKDRNFSQQYSGFSSSVSFSPLTLPKTDHLGENQPLSHRQSCRKAQKGKELRSADQPSVSLKVALPSPLTPSAAAPSPVHWPYERFWTRDSQILSDSLLTETVRY